MSDQFSDPEAPVHECSSWADIVQCLEAIPFSELRLVEGDMTNTEWVFRGLTDSRFPLEPAIERKARSKGMEWRALEKLVALEFKSRARLHLNAPVDPDLQDEFTRLAQMQHYGIPTRLLDFTYSPFVALYFAIRDQRNDEKRSHVRLWAIDAVAVNRRFKDVARKAEATARERAGEKRPPSIVSTDPDDGYTYGDLVGWETPGFQKLIADALPATGTHRVELNLQGCVAAASPPTFNPRLASQQGVFLMNLAEGLSFCESLNKMMTPHTTEWCRRFDLAIDSIPEVEQRLFRMNIHEQSLFPDIEGLAGLIRQKVRLHWK